LRAFANFTLLRIFREAEAVARNSPMKAQIRQGELARKSTKWDQKMFRASSSLLNAKRSAARSLPAVKIFSDALGPNLLKKPHGRYLHGVEHVFNIK
jgi:hypothetical protein